jgi:hypothetical protein
MMKNTRINSQTNNNNNNNNNNNKGVSTCINQCKKKHKFHFNHSAERKKWQSYNILFETNKYKEKRTQQHHCP